MGNLIEYKNQQLVKNLITTSTIKKQALEKPEVQNGLTNSEMLTAASCIAIYDENDKIIASRKPIRGLTNDELSTEIQQTLKWIVRDIGIKNWSGEDASYESSRFFKLLREHYDKLTYKEVEMAFELSITGKLDDYLPRNGRGEPDKSHYQSFNAEYVSKILNAYIKYKNKLWGKINHLTPAEQRQITEAEKKETNSFFISEIKNRFERFVSTGEKEEFLEPYSIYIMLRNSGLINEEIKITNEEKSLAFRQYLQNSNFTGILKDQLNKAFESESEHPSLNAVFRTAKYSKAIWAAFEQCKQKKQNIVDLLK